MRDTATSVIDNSTVGTKKKTLYPSQNRSRHPPRTEAFPLRKAFSILSRLALSQHNLAHSQQMKLMLGSLSKATFACLLIFAHTRKKKTTEYFPRYSQARTHARFFVYAFRLPSGARAIHSFGFIRNRLMFASSPHTLIYMYVHMCVLHRF